MSSVSLLGYSVGLSIVGSFAGLFLASSVLLVRDATRVRLVSWLVSYAVGTLLGASLLHLLPEALAVLPPTGALGSLLVGILTFFVLEKLVIWRHCHEPDECSVQQARRRRSEDDEESGEGEPEEEGRDSREAGGRASDEDAGPEAPRR